MKSITIKTDGTVIVEEHNEIVPSLEQMQEAVGGYIERVYSNYLEEKDIDVFANEEGLLMELPYNILASLVVNLYNKLPNLIHIVGDVYIISHNEEESTWLTDEQASFIIDEIGIKNIANKIIYR